MTSDTIRFPEQHKIFLVPRPYNPRDWDDAILDQKTYTSRDYQNLPEGAPYQLIGGKLVMNPSPDIQHQRLSGILEYQLRSFVAEHGLGDVFDAPTDVQFSEHDVYQPDMFFISRSRMEIIGTKRIQGAPDLIIEILSPSTAYFDLREKYETFELCGVREYWLVDPERKEIEIYINHNTAFSLSQKMRTTGNVSSTVLEGFAVSLDEIFSSVDTPVRQR